VTQKITDTLGVCNLLRHMLVPGCKERHHPFPGLMSYKANSPTLIWNSGLDTVVIPFRVSSRGEMYIGNRRRCVCLCVCLSVPRRIPTLLHGSGCKLRNGMGCPLVVHYWADLQSVHGFRCFDNIAQNAKSQRLLYSLYAWFIIVRLTLAVKFFNRSAQYFIQLVTSLKVCILAKFTLTFAVCNTRAPYSAG